MDMNLWLSLRDTFTVLSKRFLTYLMGGTQNPPIQIKRNRRLDQSRQLQENFERYFFYCPLKGLANAKVGRYAIQKIGLSQP